MTISGRRGKVPGRCRGLGWQRKPNGRWTPSGTRIGWVAGSDLFLDPGASYQVAQELAGSERLVGAQTLRHRLRESGLLASVDTGRQMVQVRRTLEARPRQVLHLKAITVVEPRTHTSPRNQNMMPVNV